MIEKAIRLGFTDYCITEHAPLPASFEASYEGPREGYETASLGFDQLEEYFEHAEWLKERFKGKINVHIGFETDYLPGFETEIKNFLMNTVRAAIQEFCRFISFKIQKTNSTVSIFHRKIWQPA